MEAIAFLLIGGPLVFIALAIVVLPIATLVMAPVWIPLVWHRLKTGCGLTVQSRKLCGKCQQARYDRIAKGELRS